ncbi:hypothetical protein [Deinococcus maricopensis]|uniref:Uncharacterized protein n=1 Tax=Deinococcus maricopensis (strain DSM 21211 / LMG 22137 / NRRL B-23946 / LB-34) TaxID=709986 RepID=E8U6P2_DEIML|nr:hypothetical protein [Deinococcus maricopensis]ADV66731.1 hypothetical protein Deima_1078 [Deinococcus maricopensis DSM 21211]
MSDELNFAKTILAGRSYRDVPDDEILTKAERLLDAWMTGEARMERPKLYDHYALVFAALLRRVHELEGRVATLEGQKEPHP